MGCFDHSQNGPFRIVPKHFGTLAYLRATRSQSRWCIDKPEEESALLGDDVQNVWPYVWLTANEGMIGLELFLLRP